MRRLSEMRRSSEKSKHSIYIWEFSQTWVRFSVTRRFSEMSISSIYIWEYSPRRVDHRFIFEKILRDKKILDLYLRILSEMRIPSEMRRFSILYLSIFSEIRRFSIYILEDSQGWEDSQRRVNPRFYIWEYSQRRVDTRFIFE